MKKFIKVIPVYMTVVMILCCSLFVPAFAASADTDFIGESHPNCIYVVGGTCVSAEGFIANLFLLPVGEYVFDFNFSYELIPEDIRTKESLYVDDVFSVCLMNVMVNTFTEIKVVPGEVFTITEDMVASGFTDEYEYLNGKAAVWVNSYGTEPTVSVYNRPGMYYEAFDMFAGFIYGKGVELTAEQNMVLTIMATTAVLFVVCVPFLIVFWVIRLFR